MSDRRIFDALASFQQGVLDGADDEPADENTGNILVDRAYGMGFKLGQRLRGSLVCRDHPEQPQHTKKFQNTKKPEKADEKWVVRIVGKKGAKVRTPPLYYDVEENCWVINHSDVFKAVSKDVAEEVIRQARPTTPPHYNTPEPHQL